jgi:hypothetical protein
MSLKVFFFTLNCRNLSICDMSHFTLLLQNYIKDCSSLTTWIHCKLMHYGTKGWKCVVCVGNFIILVTVSIMVILRNVFIFLLMCIRVSFLHQFCYGSFRKFSFFFFFCHSSILEVTKLFSNLKEYLNLIQYHTTHILLLCQKTNSDAEWEMDINSKCKNHLQIVWQSKGICLWSHIVLIYLRKDGVSPPIEFKAGTWTNSFHGQCKPFIQETGMLYVRT